MGAWKGKMRCLTACILLVISLSFQILIFFRIWQLEQHSLNTENKLSFSFFFFFRILGAWKGIMRSLVDRRLSHRICVYLFNRSHHAGPLLARYQSSRVPISGERFSHGSRALRLWHAYGMLFRCDVTSLYEMVCL